MARHVLAFIVLCLSLLAPPALAERDETTPGKPLITLVEVKDQELIVMGSGLVKSIKDQFFFASQNAGTLIALPFAVEKDDTLRVQLPYQPSTGVYRIGIGVNENSLRVSELVTLFDDTGCFNGDDDDDGSPNGVDAFPDDPAASLDTDGDGMPDEWNASATEEQITSSNLVVDAFPDDASESVDADGDGIGNNADNDDDGDGYSDDVEIDNGTDPLDANSFPKFTEDIAGVWTVSQQDGSLGVGPAEFDVSWWSNAAGVTAMRSCYFDDKYVFYEDGSFANVQQDRTWVEGWQGAATDACAAPVAPHDGSISAGYVYNPETQTLTVSGLGAYIGQPKTINGAEIPSPADAASSITYNAYVNGDNTMTVTIEVGAGVWWNYTLEKVGNAPPVTNDSPCGNDYCVLNEKQFSDSDRAYFYNLSDDFSDFPFDQSEYQLSRSRESGSDNFEFEVEVDGQARLIELGNESFDAIKADDYEVLANAFRNAGSQPVRLRRISQGNRWLEFRLDGPDESVKVIFADLEIQNIDTLVQENTTVRVNRPTPGTGNRGGFNGPDTNCISFSYDPLTNLVESNLVASTATNLRDDMYVGGGQLLSEAVICDTTSPGTSEHEMTVIDGRGGKTNLSLKLIVLEELVDGGNIEWLGGSDRDGDGYGEGQDDFPLDPAASLDTDGDGMPDDWNEGASEAQINASTLVLDTDDDNDGVPDSSDYFPRDPDAAGTPVDQALAGLVDANFRECVAYWSRDAQFAEEVTFIDCIAVESLEGLRAFSRLEQVFVDNVTRDFSELAYLPLLRVLEQDNGPSPETLEPIRGNTNLEFLQLQGVEGAELEVDIINTLTNLERLGFNYSNIPVLPDFSVLTNLKVLNIYRTNTQDIQTVELLSGLTELGSFDNPLSSIYAVSQLPSLTKLSITGAGLTDISSISDLTELTELVLGGNDLNSLESLADLTKLTKLWLDGNVNLDVSFLPNADQLTDLRLDYTGITDLSVLGRVPNVETLYLNGNNIVDYEPLRQLTRLRALHLSEMKPPLTSLGQLPAIESLRDLWLYGNEISVLMDTNNPWVTFYYLPANPLSCSVQEEFLGAYPNAEIYDAENSCVPDTDSDNDGLSDADEDRMGLDKLNPDSDSDGVLDGQDEYSLIVSGEFPEFTFDVITPFSSAADGFLGIRSPTGCEVDTFSPEITGNRARYAWTATENTPSGSYWIAGGATRQIGTSGQISYADDEYELVLENQSGVQSSAEFVDWSIGPEGVMLSAVGLVNGAAPRYDYTDGILPEGSTQASDKPIVVSLQIGANGEDTSLGVEPRLESETDGVALIQSEVLAPEVYEDARISRVWLCDGALNRTDVGGPDSDGDGAIDIFDAFPEDPSRFRL